MNTIKAHYFCNLVLSWQACSQAELWSPSTLKKVSESVFKIMHNLEYYTELRKALF